MNSHYISQIISIQQRHVLKAHETETEEQKQEIKKHDWWNSIQQFTKKRKSQLLQSSVL